MRKKTVTNALSIVTRTIAIVSIMVAGLVGCVSTPKTPPPGPTIKIQNVHMTRDSKRFLKAFLPVFRPGQSQGELKPLIEDVAPKGHDVFLIVDCSLDFPRDSININLEDDLFLIDAAGNKEFGSYLIKDTLTDASGKTLIGIWHRPGKVTLTKRDDSLNLLFCAPEDQMKAFKLQFLNKAYPLWPSER